MYILSITHYDTFKTADLTCRLIDMLVNENNHFCRKTILSDIQLGQGSLVSTSAYVNPGH